MTTTLSAGEHGARPHHRRVAWICGLVLVFGMVWVDRVAAQRDDEGRALVVGETGLVTIPMETRVGKRLTLGRGRYRLEHRVKDSTHYVKFALVSTSYRTARNKTGGEVRCRLEPLDARASRTVIFTVSESFVDEQSRVFFDRITRIEIRGENVAHLFPIEDN